MSRPRVKQPESASMGRRGKDQHETPSTPVQSPMAPRGDVVIELPPTDNREHKYLRLSNGLECMLVSDPMCDKAAAAMDVGVGSTEDPVNLPGCAHFWYLSCNLASAHPGSRLGGGPTWSLLNGQFYDLRYFHQASIFFSSERKSTRKRTAFRTICRRTMRLTMHTHPYVAPM